MHDAVNVKVLERLINCLFGSDISIDEMEVWERFQAFDVGHG